MSVSQRWEIAKKFILCCRCLEDGHLGQACTRSRICGLDGCRETHNRLLHKNQNSLKCSELREKELVPKIATE